MGAAGGQRRRGQGPPQPHVADPLEPPAVDHAAGRVDADRAPRRAYDRRVRRLPAAVLQRRARVLAVRPLVREAVLVGPPRLSVLTPRSAGRIATPASTRRLSVGSSAGASVTMPATSARPSTVNGEAAP